MTEIFGLALGLWACVDTMEKYLLIFLSRKSIKRTLIKVHNKLETTDVNKKELTAANCNFFVVAQNTIIQPHYFSMQ